MGMRITARLGTAALAAASLLLITTGCASGSGASGGSLSTTQISPPDGEVVGTGTVLDVAGDVALCLGPIAESYPPQCTGPEIVGWNWDAIDIKETANDVTWGTFAVFGTWDGATFAVTEDPVPLALYDPMMSDPDPRLDPENAGESSDAELRAIQEVVTTDLPVDVLFSFSENGYLFVTVYYDDGSIQEFFDTVYGPDVVAVQSALVAV